MLVWLSIISLTLRSAWSYKMAFFVLDVSNSQLLLNERLAEPLAAAGHDVTLILMAPQSDRDRSDVKIKGNINVHIVNASTGLSQKDMDDKDETFVYQLDKEIPGYKMLERLKMQTKLVTDTCQATIKQKDFIEWLKEEKFDLAFAPMFDVCSAGLIHEANIPGWIWLNRFVAEPETQLFRELVLPKFPDLLELATSADHGQHKRPVRTTATNTCKSVNIGGVGMDTETKPSKPLPKDILDIMDGSDGALLFSFGSVAPMWKMPPSWKKMFLAVFERFPWYQFLLRYEKDDINDILPPNVHIFKWMPHSDLLRYPKTKAFITHGGYNSFRVARLLFEKYAKTDFRKHCLPAFHA